MRVRRSFAAAVSVLCALALSGCAGFLVPAGEGEPAPASSPTATSPTATSPTATSPAATVAPSTGAPSTGAPAASTPPAAGPGVTGDCPVSGARVDMGPVQTAMFHRSVVLTLTNCGTKPYRVHGYPSVRALGEDGERIPVPVNAGGSMSGQDRGIEEVTLKPGGTVTSVLAWVSTKEGGDLIEGDALEIAPAPDTGARVFPLEGHDLRLMDELNTTAWRTDLPE
ncbi:DUF4232 domain-containing protein [Streptomyces sp. NPDC058637]|uniref:DUF4232 domain-containing protein n=1 Tax=Streptomyces sp. NPDC058637 TaxID=3346569 RepID=UPI00365EA68B